MPQAAGTFNLTYTPSTSSIKVKILGTGTTTSSINWNNVQIWKPEMVQTDVLVDICEKDNDRYVYGFNGQLKTNEWAGIGNFMDYKERGQDTRVGRFLALDPLTNIFPWYSPYQFAGNTPIQAIDLDGAEEFHYTRVKDTKGNTALQLTGKNNIVDKVLIGYRSGHSFGNDAAVPVYENKVNARQVYTVHEIWREPVDKNGGLNMDQPIEWVDFDIRTYYKSYSDAVAGKNGTVSQSDMFLMRFTQYQAAVKVDNAAMPAGGVGNLRKAGAAGISAEGAVWSQKTFRQAFSEGGKLAGRTVDEVASGLRSGKIAVEEVPIDIVSRGNKKFILNTRSSTALEKAEIPRKQWNTVNRTGQAKYEEMLDGQLERNKIPNGTNTIREAGTTNALTR